MTDLPVDYGPVTAPEVGDLPRYTTLDAVKGRVGIPLENTERDPDLVEAIISAEYAIDVELGRSFPGGPGVPDVSEADPIDYVPAPVALAALGTAIAVWKEADAPTGTAGSETFIGALDVADIARRIVSRSAVLRGFKVGDAFGVA